MGFMVDCNVYTKININRLKRLYLHQLYTVLNGHHKYLHLVNNYGFFKFQQIKLRGINIHPCVKDNGYVCSSYMLYN